MDLSLKTPKELQEYVGEAMRALRLRKNLSQKELSDKSGISPRSLTSLENGGGSTLETLLRTLKALDATSAIEHLAPKATISPMAMLKNPNPPRRVRRRKLPPG